MNVEEQARTYFGQHYNCAQSVFLPFAERAGMDVKNALKIAAPFGGGLGHGGQVCGAVSGALMAIGLTVGSAVYDKERKAHCYQLAREFQTRFRALHGDVTCPGLLGVDIGDPDALEEARSREVFHALCPNFVGDAARLVEEMLASEADG